MARTHSTPWLMWYFNSKSVHQNQELEFACIQHGRNESLPVSAESETESLMQCKPFEKPHKHPEPPRCTNPVVKIASCKNDVPIAARDLSWLLLRLLPRKVLPLPSEMKCLERQVTPLWAEFNSQITERKEVFTSVAYAPVIMPSLQIWQQSTPQCSSARRCLQALASRCQFKQ